LSLSPLRSKAFSSSLFIMRTASSYMSAYARTFFTSYFCAKAASNWVTGDLFGALNRLGLSIDESPVSPKQGAELIGLVADGTLSGTLAKQVFEIMLETRQDASAIVEERGLKQTSDTGAIEAVIADVLAKNPGQLEAYRGGKEALFGFFVGQTMKAMGGKANPGVVNELLKKALAT